MIDDLILNLSNMCLGSCKYCTLHEEKNWQIDKEMTIHDIERLFADEALQNLKTIHLTGGEPFLSPKLLPTVKIIALTHPDVPVNAPISGIYTQLTYKLAKRIKPLLPQFRYNLAIEGPLTKVHESIRGKDTFVPALQTFYNLRRLGCNVRFNFTVYPENYKYIKEMKTFADDRNADLYINFGRFSRRFGNQKDGVMMMPPDVVEEIECQLADIGWFVARPLNVQKWRLQKALWEGKRVSVECLMGIRSIDVDPYGNVYPCLAYPTDGYMGNIKNTTSLSSVLNSWYAKRVLKEIANGVCQPCNFTCGLKFKSYTIDGVTYKGVNV